MLEIYKLPSPGIQKTKLIQQTLPKKTSGGQHWRQYKYSIVLCQADN